MTVEGNRCGTRSEKRETGRGEEYNQGSDEKGNVRKERERENEHKGEMKCQDGWRERRRALSAKVSRMRRDDLRSIGRGIGERASNKSMWKG